MKKTIVLALMAMAIVAVPATAQTRKDKKAAEKAQWEQQQIICQLYLNKSGKNKYENTCNFTPRKITC